MPKNFSDWAGVALALLIPLFFLFMFVVLALTRDEYRACVDDYLATYGLQSIEQVQIACRHQMGY